jgi:hypothetical protein
VGNEAGDGDAGDGDAGDGGLRFAAPTLRRINESIRRLYPGEGFQY